MVGYIRQIPPGDLGRSARCKESGAITTEPIENLKMRYKSKKTKNSAEAQCYEKLEANGWNVMHRGWPDFFCTRDGELCCVEVKPNARTHAGRYQNAILHELASRGIPCYVWSPKAGFTKYE